MRIEIDGKFYRKRRGVLVEIPSQWLNVVPTSQTLCNRRLTAKLKKRARGCIKGKTSYA